ncbi:MAG: hypothetical protein GY864_12230 [Desulfobacterales bacterium]|nr:hypothetical protein [Desulfobacterales bacterium]
MSGEHIEEPKEFDGDPLKQNEEFLKHHKEIELDDDIYCGETVERIEKECACQIICSPHFKGISFYVENQHCQDVQVVINKIYEEEKAKEERNARREIKKAGLTKKIKRRFEEAMARCEHPGDLEVEFARQCLKTLRLKDYVNATEADKYRQLHGKYPEYFKLVGWPDDVEGSSAKTYINSTLIKNMG